MSWFVTTTDSDDNETIPPFFLLSRCRLNELATM